MLVPVNSSVGNVLSPHTQSLPIATQSLVFFGKYYSSN